ncbi:hypothetical protein HO173_004752 [Letharia columbiana]|uniref:Zn(2)-C6 fungal-type domain-containing protein n=1 Tax=Letharia columbiana TaxID=112416 RepID=A0A8H6L6A9_9LECA|nr:uncharacterized protein HO173_004752 [Letharia columbiana]KAF6237283.1 hypothetical protein HO173_004752 [Letharia columbiana]
MSRSQSRSASSEDDYEDDAAMPEAQWQSQQQSSANATTSSVPSSTQPSQISLPMQKRRRVTRACDECRRKKIKCDGKQPCTHCTVYSYDCTYDQPSNRRRNPAPQYVEALENRLQRAEALLRNVLPNVDLDDPNADLGVTQRMHLAPNQGLQPHPGQARPWVPLGVSQQGNEGEKDSVLESMVTNTGSLDLDDQGNWDFYGHSSGRVFLRKMREQFGDLMGQTTDGQHAMPFLRFKSTSQPFESPKSSADRSQDPNLPNTRDLCAKNCALMLTSNALDDACAILRLVHRPTFDAMLHRIYDTPPEKFGDEEKNFLPQLYAVLALGTLFARAEQSELQKSGYDNAFEQGFNWFRIARSMVDGTDCRDLTSLQTMLFIVLFLQSSVRLSTCYSYIGIVLRSAIRMGLHRSVSNTFNPIETELRKRIWWIVRKLDTYVGALLGLPQMLSNDDIDQGMPEEIDDEYITKEGILPMPPGRLSVNVALNAHTRLVNILAKTVKYVYPIKGTTHVHGKGSHSYVVSHAKIREIEADLQKWMNNLPEEFKPGDGASPEFMRIRHLLRMAYAHCEMFLYRPFLHYVSQTLQAKNIDKRSYACAAACVSVSRNIVHLTTEMKKQGLLVGSYWFYMYTTFFSIISLVFFVLENPRSQMSESILKDAYEGKDTLAGLAAKSHAADRCSKVLADMFEQLPGKLQGALDSAPQPQKKRSAPSQLPVSQMPQRAPEINSRSQNVNNSARRSNISPNQQGSLKRSSIAQDSSPLRDQMTNLDPIYRRGSQDPYSASNNSPSSSIPSSAASSGMQNNYVPDLSSMMFPSSDPFAYPNQPMTTLENRQSIKQENPVDRGMFSPPTTSGAPYDNLDYGSLPYMMQSQQLGFGMQSMNPSMDMSNIDSTPTTMPMQGNEGGGWPQKQQQQRPGGTPGVNIDQLFGEDWGGWMNQGYRQYP